MIARGNGVVRSCTEMQVRCHGGTVRGRRHGMTRLSLGLRETLQEMVVDELKSRVVRRCSHCSSN